jgi:hypothetical protein
LNENIFFAKAKDANKLFSKQKNETQIKRFCRTLGGSRWGQVVAKPPKWVWADENREKGQKMATEGGKSRALFNN